MHSALNLFSFQNNKVFASCTSREYISKGFHNINIFFKLLPLHNLKLNQNAQKFDTFSAVCKAYCLQLKRFSERSKRSEYNSTNDKRPRYKSFHNVKKRNVSKNAENVSKNAEHVSKMQDL